MCVNVDFFFIVVVVVVFCFAVFAIIFSSQCELIFLSALFPLLYSDFQFSVVLDLEITSNSKFS